MIDNEKESYRVKRQIKRLVLWFIGTNLIICSIYIAITWGNLFQSGDVSLWKVAVSWAAIWLSIAFYKEVA